MKYNTLAVLLFFLLCTTARADFWLSTLRLDGNAAGDKLSGPTIAIGTASSSFDCKKDGYTTVFQCAWVPVYNIASTVTIRGIGGTGDSPSLYWTINNLVDTPNPSMNAQYQNQSTERAGGWGMNLTPYIPVETVAVQFPSPVWILATNGPSGETYRTLGGSILGFGMVTGTTLYARYTFWGSRVTGGKWYQGSAKASDGSMVVIPEEVLPSVVCNFSISEDIDLGTIDQTNASGTTSYAMLSTTCTGDATVTGVIKQLNGSGNSFQMGGLDISVLFNNGRDTVSYSANKGITTQRITASIGQVGNVVPGEYSRAMIVQLDYQ